MAHLGKAISSQAVEALGLGGPNLKIGQQDKGEFPKHLDRTKRKSFWEDLKFALPHDSLLCLIMGDFNVILSPEDKKSIYAIGKRCNIFGNFVDSCNLEDLGFIGPSFTWQKVCTIERLDRALDNDSWISAFPQCIISHLSWIKPEDKKSIYAIGKRCNIFGNFVDSCNLEDLGFIVCTIERLDRALDNDSWISAFPQCIISHLSWIKSDHRPILLRTNLDISLAIGRPFRFLVRRTKHANFSSFVKGSHKRLLIRSLSNIQKALDHSTSFRLIQLKIDVRDELENLLNHKKLLWRQKARCDWLQFGDRNTKFFYSRTIQRRKFNHIIALCMDNGEWCSD
ncbi:LINE-1 reverse transcriptase isogeny [Gossypium australe]|uniref:LINE-1 reverse transcriptase isogeny n=1 Tax=Gossypium australe TaxID=47621 RepID=A0A5B6VWA3_9ROSI|nr:LINE-1 reverse transcriptase isogeny [Gossypium australe]